jgi:hypothetical protein
VSIAVAETAAWLYEAHPIDGFRLNPLGGVTESKG